MTETLHLGLIGDNILRSRSPLLRARSRAWLRFTSRAPCTKSARTSSSSTWAASSRPLCSAPSWIDDESPREPELHDARP